MNPIPGQANIRARDLVARADGSPITEGDVNYYLVANTGANAGKWFKTSDNTWSATEAVAAALAHKADGHWTGSVDTEAWIDGVEYVEYAKETTDLHVPTSALIRCEKDAAWLKQVAEGDTVVDTTKTPWEIVVKIKGTATELIRKKLYTATGAAVTSTTQLVGKMLESAP